MRWLVATVVETEPETPVAVTLRLDVRDWPGHRAGQHVDVQLTADDGYSAERSYSIASRPGAKHVELTIVRIDNGEVSPYLTTVVEAGDQFEVRGPIGRHFVWDGDDARPVLLVGGGSGVVPLMAMLRHHAATEHNAPIQLVYSVRTEQDIMYRDELAQLCDRRRGITVTLTREAPVEWSGRVGRVNRTLLSELGWPHAEEPRCFVCGPTPFVETVVNALIELGHEPANVKAERFGPTGA